MLATIASTLSFIAVTISFICVTNMCITVFNYMEQNKAYKAEVERLKAALEDAASKEK